MSDHKDSSREDAMSDDGRERRWQMEDCTTSPAKGCARVCVCVCVCLRSLSFGFLLRSIRLSGEPPLRAVLGISVCDIFCVVWSHLQEDM